MNNLYVMLTVDLGATCASISLRGVPAHFQKKKKRLAAWFMSYNSMASQI